VSLLDDFARGFYASKALASALAQASFERVQPQDVPFI